MAAAAREGLVCAEREGGDRAPEYRRGGQPQKLAGLRQVHISVKDEGLHQTPGSCRSKCSLMRLKSRC